MNLIIIAVVCMVWSGCSEPGQAPSPEPKMQEEAPPAATPEAAAEEMETKVEETSTTPETMPDEFKVRFTCSNGTFVAEFRNDWAPIGARQIWDLVKSGFYDQARFFRVVPNFVVQFGIAGDPEVHAKWKKEIRDDNVRQSNKRGTISFATRGPNTRTTQLFINLRDNANLDGMGFAPVGEVIEGMDVVDSINPEYGEQPQQPLIEQMGNEYLKDAFPNLDYIEKAEIIP
jgi:peptidyl-prolyl cis-trans isomerase A (cyclophilin A)